MSNEKEIRPFSIGIKTVKSSRPYFAEQNNSVSDVNDDFDDNFDDGFGAESFRMHMALMHVFEWDFNPLDLFKNNTTISGVIIGKKPLLDSDDDEVGFIFLVYNKDYVGLGCSRDAEIQIPCFYSLSHKEVILSIEIGDFVSFSGYIPDIIYPDYFDPELLDDCVFPMKVNWEEITIIEKHFFQNHNLSYDD